MPCRKCSTETYMGLCPICDKLAYLEAMGAKGRVFECPCGWKFAGPNATEEHARHVSQCISTVEGRLYLARRQIGLFQRLFSTPNRLREIENEHVEQLTGKWAARQKQGPTE